MFCLCILFKARASFSNYQNHYSNINGVLLTFEELRQQIDYHLAVSFILVLLNTHDN